MQDVMHALEQYMRGMVELRKRGQVPAPEGFVYSCFEEYVLRHGRMMKSEPLTDEEERIVREALGDASAQGADVHEFRQCFANAQTLVLTQNTAELVYFEGYAFGRVSGFPVHHGWISINDKVIDLTWALETPASRSLLPDRPVGALPEGYAYWGFPVENTDYLRVRTVARGMIGSLLDDWKDDFPLLRGVDPNDEASWRAA